MFTNEEGEGWQQLGDSLMPTSNKDAGVFLEGLHQMGEQTLHSVFSGTSLPELHDALGAMFGPKPLAIDASASQFPGIDLFDSANTVPQADMQTGAGSQNVLGSGESLANTESSYFQAGQAPDASSAGISDAGSPLSDMGKAVSEVVSKMTEMISSLAQGPLGLLGGLLSFLLNLFSQVLSTIGQVLNETARAAAALAAETWKKHLEMTS